MPASDWRRVGLLVAAVAGLHVLGFVLLGTSGALGIGVGVTAYTLGLRHAFDADHIATIDNTTRKLMHDGQRPVSVGFWFSLGHSSVVFALAVLVAVGVRGVGAAVQDDGSTLHRATGLVGPLVSGSFLLLIGVLNLVVLAGIVSTFRSLRRGEIDAEQAHAHAHMPTGLLGRVYGRAVGTVRRPWQMLPLGVLFGLGFDTATEVALLVLAGGAAASDLPVQGVLCLPILFAAGMSLFDTLDGAFMRVAYGWAQAHPARALFYNITVTGLSVAVALLIGGMELLSVIADRLHLSGGVWDVVAAIDLNAVGYVVVALFAITWAGSVAVWCVIAPESERRQRVVAPAALTGSRAPRSRGSR
jgi:high-affinity nickel-transport protein